MADLTKEQIVQRLQTDLDFGLNFIVANGADEIRKVLSSRGVNITEPKDILIYLKDRVQKVPSDIEEILKDVKYNPNASNWTSGLQNEFEKAQSDNSEAQGNTRGFLAILPSILSGVGSVVNAINMNQNGGLGGVDQFGNPITVEQAQWERERAERIRQEEEARRRRNTIAIGVVFGVILIGTVAYFVVKSRKKNGVPKS